MTFISVGALVCSIVGVDDGVTFISVGCSVGSILVADGRAPLFSAALHHSGVEKNLLLSQTVRLIHGHYSNDNLVFHRRKDL